MKKKYIIILIIVTLILSILVPIIINECYKPNTGYMTLWGANDVLSYFGNIIGAFGTVFIGVIALAQSAQANKISIRLLQLEEKKNTPFLFIDIDKSYIETFQNRQIDISIYLNNSSDNVINILGVSDLKMSPFLLVNSAFDVPFSKGQAKHYSILPSQSRRMNFFIEASTKEEPINNFDDLYNEKALLHMTCEFTATLGYVNSSDVFEQTYVFYLMIPKVITPQMQARFEEIESSIIKTETLDKK